MKKKSLNSKIFAAPTFQSGFSDSLFATTAPAEPPPNQNFIN